MSDLIRELYFADAFYYKDFENSSEMNKNLISKILEWKHDDPEGDDVSNSFGWQSRKTMQKVKSGFADVTNKINEFLNEVWSTEQYHEDTTLEISNMWANINYKYAYNMYHDHPNSLWSGVYYVQSPPNSGKILFHKEWSRYQGVPKPTFSSSPPVHTHQWDSVSYEPIEGRVILFPSWIGHQVGQNLTDVEGEDGYRISISFNIKQIDDTRWYLN